MKRLAIPLILAISMLLVADLSAQTPERFRFGVMAGTQITHARVQSSQYNFTNAAPDQLGWMAGMVAQFDIVNKLMLEASLGLTGDAVHTDGFVKDSFGSDYAIDANEDFIWIGNSVSLKYMLLSKPSLLVYGGVGFTTHKLIDALLQYDYNDHGGDGIVIDTNDLIQKWNYALPIAVGVEFPMGGNRLSCTFAYHIGLRGVYTPIPSYNGVHFEDGFYRMNAASVSLGYNISVSGRASDYE